MFSVGDFGYVHVAINSNDVSDYMTKVRDAQEGTSPDLSTKTRLFRRHFQIDWLTFQSHRIILPI